MTELVNSQNNNTLITIVDKSFLKEYVKENFQFRSDFKKLQNYAKSFNGEMEQVIVFSRHDFECKKLSGNGPSYIKDYFKRIFSNEESIRATDIKIAEEQIKIFEEKKRQEQEEKEEQETEEKLQEKLDRYLDDRFTADDKIKLRDYHKEEYERIKEERSADEGDDYLTRFEVEANWNKLEKQDKRYLRQVEQKIKQEKKEFEEKKKVKKETDDTLVAAKEMRDFQNNEKLIFNQIEEWKVNVNLKLEWQKDYSIRTFEKEIEQFRSGVKSFESKNTMILWLYERFAKFIRRATLGKDDLMIYKKNCDFTEDAVVETPLTTFRNSQKNFFVWYYPITGANKCKYYPFTLLEETSLFNCTVVDWIPYHPLKDDPSSNSVLNTFIGHHFTRKVREHLQTHPDLSLTAEELERANIFRNPLKDVMLSGEEEAFKRLENYIASIIQDPTTLFAMQLFLRKQGGGGSTTLLEDFLLARVLGNFTAYKSLEHATKEFNGLMYKKTNILIREAKPKSDDTINAQNDNKDDITDATFQVRQMYCDPRPVRNVRHWWCLSNHFDSFQVTKLNKRRYRMYAPSESHCNDVEYFSKLRSQLLNEEMAFLIYRYYSCVKIDTFLLHEEFCTKLMGELIDENQAPAIKFLNEVATGYFDLNDLQMQIDIFQRDIKDPNIIWIQKKDFYKQFKAWLSEKYVRIPNIADCKFFKDIKNEKILGHIFFEVPEGRTLHLERIKVKLDIKHFQQDN